jgi:hypothetical protein
MQRMCVPAIVACHLLFAAADATAQDRRGMWWRIAGGVGDTHIAADQSGVAESIEGGAGGVSGGWTLREWLLIGGEYHLWLKTLNEEPMVDAYITSLLGTVTWYPLKDLRLRLIPYVKGGAGMMFRHTDRGKDNTVTIAMGKGAALTAGIGLDLGPGGAVSWTIEFDVIYGYMGGAARTDIFPRANQRVTSATVGLSIH